MNVVFLSLGGNRGNRLENLQNAVNKIKDTGAEVVKASSVYETEAWGSNSKNKYLNQVIKLKTPLGGSEFLSQTLRIEKQLGRKRTNDKNADRSIDIDLLFFNKEIIHTKGLQVPHPRLHLRKFVLVPFNEIDGKFKHPTLKKSIKELLQNCPDLLEVKLYSTQRQFKYICIEGNIGSGKSTIASALAKKLKADFIPEPFEDNHFLPLFYDNPKNYAFQVEYSFFVNRLQQLLGYFKSPGQLLITDFSLYKSLWFAKVNLSKTDYAFFKKKVEPLLEELPQPNLIIHLNTELKNLKQNISKRGRPYEKKIGSNYLQAISDEYKKGLGKIPRTKKYDVQIKKYGSDTEQKVVEVIVKKLMEIF